MNILVFAPHPDDDIIGCGGSILRHVQEGAHVTIVYITSGESGCLDYTKEELAAVREKEAKDGEKVLGVDDLIFMHQKDGYVKFNEETLAQTTSYIRTIQPDIIYVTHAKDNHYDHKVTHRLVMEAAKRSGMASYQEYTGKPWTVKTILCYEVWTPLQHVQYIEDITDNMPKKIKALQKHKSQLTSLNYVDAVISLNNYRGVMSEHGKYCECFEVMKISKI